MLIAAKVVRRSLPLSFRETVHKLGLKSDRIGYCIKDLVEFVKDTPTERLKGLRKFHGKHLSDLKSGVISA